MQYSEQMILAHAISTGADSITMLLTTTFYQTQKTEVHHLNKQEVYTFLRSNPVCFFGTSEQNIPHVRGMLLFSADEEGIIFHTSTARDMTRQIQENSNVELCFADSNALKQMRVSGIMEIVADDEMKDFIADHPSRTFVGQMRDDIGRQAFYDTFVVLRMCGGIARFWSYEANLDAMSEIQLD